mmetsp:Transcript_25708/g.72640  ORF Transcript_25708/g.72640 Transcript_25708/m.72640 type:complete len:301 (+) Transcript_25708:1318-2220(+)
MPAAHRGILDDDVASWQTAEHHCAAMRQWPQGPSGIFAELPKHTLAALFPHFRVHCGKWWRRNWRSRWRSVWRRHWHGLRRDFRRGFRRDLRRGPGRTLGCCSTLLGWGFDDEAWAKRGGQRDHVASIDAAQGTAVDAPAVDVTPIGAAEVLYTEAGLAARNTQVPVADRVAGNDDVAAVLAAERDLAPMRYRSPLPRPAVHEHPGGWPPAAGGLLPEEEPQRVCAEVLRVLRPAPVNMVPFAPLLSRGGAGARGDEEVELGEANSELRCRLNCALHPVVACVCCWALRLELLQKCRHCL